MKDRKKLAISEAEMARDRDAWAVVMRELREARGLSYEGAAEPTTLCGKAVWKIEEKRCHPRQQTLRQLCRVYGVPFSVAALLVELRQEGVLVPVKRVFRLWRLLRRIFRKVVTFGRLNREKK